MRKLLTLGGIALLSACSATETLRAPCSMDAATQAKAMEAIAARLPTVPDVRPEQYIKEPFEPVAVYNGKESCSFIIRPWQPIDSELIWDGSLSFKVNKTTLEVEDVQVIDS